MNWRDISNKATWGSWMTVPSSVLLRHPSAHWCWEWDGLFIKKGELEWGDRRKCRCGYTRWYGWRVVWNRVKSILKESESCGG